MKLPSNQTHDILQFFGYEHLPVELRRVSKPFHDLAHELSETLSGPELDAGLRKLLEAKDCVVRSAIVQDRSTLTRADVPAP